MKIHYKTPFIQANGAACGFFDEHDKHVTRDYREVNCVRCISAMSPGEQAWHDGLNTAWIKHKVRDGRRKR